MKLIEDMIKRFKAIDLNKLTLEAVAENNFVVVDMVAENQLFEEGETGHGVEISSFAPYSPFTIEIKKAKGQPYNRVTLRDEGDFQKSFFVYIGSDYFEVKADDWKTEQLKFQYGDDILLINDQNLATLLHDIIIPYIINKVKNG